MNDQPPIGLGRELDPLLERLARRIAHLLQQQQTATATAEQQSPWLNTTSAAAYLDWPKQRLYKLAAAGAIPHYKQDGRLLFHRHELDRWLAHHAHGPR